MKTFFTNLKKHNENVQTVIITIISYNSYLQKNHYKFIDIIISQNKK